MSKQRFLRILLTGCLIGPLTIHSQEPLVIQPARVQQTGYLYAREVEPEGVLSFLEMVLTQEKIVTCAIQGKSSGLNVYNLDTLEEDLCFYCGRFAHKGQIKEEMKKIEHDLAKASMEKQVAAIWDPRNFADYRYESMARNHNKITDDDYKVIAEEKAASCREWFELLQENKRPPGGREPLGSLIPYIGDSGMYGGSVMAVSPDGRYFHCWQRDYTLPEGAQSGFWVFDLKTEQKRPSIYKFHGNIDQPFKLSPDGKWGVVRSYNLILTDPVTGETRKELKYPYTIANVFFSADSKYVAAIGGEAYVWEVASGKLLGTLDIGMDGKMRKGFFNEMNRTTPKLAEFSPSGRFLFQRGVTGGLDHLEKYKALGNHTSIIWEIAKHRLVTSLPKSAMVRFEGWGPTDDLVFLSEQDHLALVHLSTGKTVAKLMQPANGVSRIIPKVRETSLPFRTFCRASDGLVLSEYMSQTDENAGRKYFTGYLIRWDLKPVMAEILKRTEALNAPPVR